MSRVNFGAKPVMYPMPVLIIATYDENGVPDAMNAAWGMRSPSVCQSIRPRRIWQRPEHLP